MRAIVIVTSRMNERVIDNVQSQLDNEDSFLVVELPKFPSRKMDEVIRTIGDQDALIIIISPFTDYVEENFVGQLKERASVIGHKLFVANPRENIVDLVASPDLIKIKMDDAVAFFKSGYRRILGDISPHAEYITCLRKLTEQVGSGVAYIPVQRILNMKEYELMVARKRADDLFIMEQERIKEENKQREKDEALRKDIELREKSIEEELKKRADARKRRQEAAAQMKEYREQKRQETLRDERVLDARTERGERINVTANRVEPPSVMSKPPAPAQPRAYKPTPEDLKTWNNWMEE